MSELKEINERFEKDNQTARQRNLPPDPSYPDPDYYFSATYKLLLQNDKLQAQLAAVKNCQRYTHLDASTGNLELCVSYTELKAAIGESE